MNQIPVTFKRSPLQSGVEQHYVRQGQTVDEILRSIPNMPHHIWTHGIVRIGDWEIPRDRWKAVRPKSHKHLVMLVGIRLSGGGGDGGKDTFATIAAIALLAVGTFITAGGLAGTALASATGFSFTAGSTSAALLAAGVSVAGALAINALTPAPTTEETEERESGTGGGSASVQSNPLGIFKPLPYVVGRRRVSPPHLILPWSESVQDDQYIHVIVGLDGAHDIEGIEINDTPIDEIEDIEYETRDVINDNSDITLITKQVFEDQVDTLMSQHRVKDGATNELRDEDIPSLSYPIFHGFQSKDVPDEIWFNLAFTSLLWTADQSSGQIAFRIEIKREGDSGWVELPEVHLVRNIQAPFRATVKLSWLSEDFSQFNIGDLDGVAQGDNESIWKAAYIDVPEENFAANGYFDDGNGESQHVRSDRFTVTFFLDPEIFPKGVYSVRIKRSYSFQASSWSFTNYTYSTNDPYLFTHTPVTDPPTIRATQNNAPVKVTITSLSSVWDEKPLGENDMTLIAIRAKNVSITRISAIFTGYANIWSGSDWGNFVATRNPAAWLRALALGQNSVRAPYVESQLNDSELTEWFNYCDNKQLESNLYVQTRQSLGQVLGLIASAGHASPRQSDKLGVVIDRNRESEAPVQIFSQRNAANLVIRRAFPQVPHGFRIRFDDEDDGYKPSEIFVFREGFDEDTGTDIEEMVYQSITNENRARDRARLDFGQLIERAAIYEFECDIEHLYATKGTMIGLAYDALARHHGAGRVKEVLTVSNLVTGLVLEDVLRLHLVNDLGLVEDLGDPTDLGEVFVSGVAIQLHDGTTLVKEIEDNDDTDTITFVEPFEMPTFLAGSDIDNAIDVGCLVVSGPVDTVYKRCFVLGIYPQGGMTARIVAIDEAPEITRPQIAATITATGTIEDTDGVVGVSSLSLAGTVVSDKKEGGQQNYITIPSNARRGDLVVYAEKIGGPANDIGQSPPSGFELIDTRSVSSTDQNISYRIIENDDEAGDDIIGRGSEDPGDFDILRMALLIRGNGVINSVTVNDVAGEAVTGDPASQTVNASGAAGDKPIAVFGVYGATTTIAGETFSPAEDEEVVVVDPDELNVKIKFYDAGVSPGPFDHTVDMVDEGGGNFLQSFYLEIS